MSVLIVKARVSQYTEEEFDLLLMDIEPNEKPPIVWRMQAIPVEEIKYITQFNKSKSILGMAGDYEILVQEAFDSLSLKWEGIRKEYFKDIDFNNEISETITNDEED